MKKRQASDPAAEEVVSASVEAAPTGAPRKKPKLTTTAELEAIDARVNEEEALMRSAGDSDVAAATAANYMVGFERDTKRAWRVPYSNLKYPKDYTDVFLNARGEVAADELDCPLCATWVNEAGSSVFTAPLSGITVREYLAIPIREHKRLKTLANAEAGSCDGWGNGDGVPYWKKTWTRQGKRTILKVCKGNADGKALLVLKVRVDSKDRQLVQVTVDRFPNFEGGQSCGAEAHRHVPRGRGGQARAPEGSGRALR